MERLHLKLFFKDIEDENTYLNFIKCATSWCLKWAFKGVVSYFSGESDEEITLLPNLSIIYQPIPSSHSIKPQNRETVHH